jgi:hypothetical protein
MLKHWHLFALFSWHTIFFKSIIYFFIVRFQFWFYSYFSVGHVLHTK